MHSVRKAPPAAVIPGWFGILFPLSVGASVLVAAVLLGVTGTELARVVLGVSTGVLAVLDEVR